MKRLLSISFVCAAIAMMVSASVVPHHHHGDGVCINPDHGHCHGQEEGCVAELEYTDRCERREGCGCEACGHVWHSHFIAYVCPDNDMAAPDGPETEEADIGTPPILYHSVYARTGCGLRAPPAHLG